MKKLERFELENHALEIMEGYNYTTDAALLIDIQKDLYWEIGFPTSWEEWEIFESYINVMINAIERAGR
ncbi:MAG: hypothetical protein II630_03270 [Bacteroidales bacterium]|nr:hypothetical protein [Bacteroidales bacterium]